MTTAAPSAAPTTTLPESDTLAPEEGWVRMPGCYDSIPDDIDTIAAHEAVCADCASILA